MSNHVHKSIANAVSSGAITLSAEDLKIIDLLRNVLRHFQLQDTLRVAGGWVRDKLMGLSSLDIDITSDNASGLEMAKKVGEYLKAKGEAEKAKYKLLPAASQSEHLDVATIEVYGLEIDFNRLRREVYEDHSRIPTVSTGTILEDAARRDLTINALYYNINNDSIEDYTDNGLEDLENKLVRTTCEPFKSFDEDPLRVLRAIRYAGRYAFSLDPATEEAMKDCRIREKLLQKVTRERYGQEVEKMFKADNPIMCLDLLCRLNLYATVFAVPETFGIDPTAEHVPFSYFPVPLHMLTAADIRKASIKIAKIAGHDIVTMGEFSQEEVRLIVLSSFFSPLWGYVCLDKSSSKAKGVERSIVFHILRHSLRLKKSIATDICSTLLHTQQFLACSRGVLAHAVERANATRFQDEHLLSAAPEAMQVDNDDDDDNDNDGDGDGTEDLDVREDECNPPVSPSSAQQQMQRSLPAYVPRPPDRLQIRIGRTVRDAGTMWRVQLALADVFAKHFHTFVIERYLPSHMLLGWIEGEGLATCYRWKPLLTGKELQEDAGVQRGRDIGVCSQFVIDYMMLARPGTQEGAIAYVKSKYEAHLQAH